MTNVLYSWCFVCNVLGFEFIWCRFIRGGRVYQYEHQQQIMEQVGFPLALYQVRMKHHTINGSRNAYNS